MTTARRERFIRAQLAWMLGATLVLVVVDALSYELIFLVSLFGFLVILGLTAPVAVTPAWRRRLRWLIGAGIVVFAYIIIREVQKVLPPGVI